MVMLTLFKVVITMIDRDYDGANLLVLMAVA